ncbi:uncharacterized protein LOC143915092 [Arctopsyche grandis]|uniref:uncharacterized protein LOC143915092 n=1 Tax=Arctopsyche grandis TaxID=121162 RepID=UPI00406D6C42
MDKSVDSIGSCSLDVDADNTDFSDTTSGSLNILTPSSTTSHYREFASKFQERATPGLRQDLRGLPLKEEAYLKPYPQDTSVQSKPCFGGVPPPKKPSYLHLACSINGYSNLTTYDSTLRQKLSRSRENSPARPGNISSFVMLRNRTDDAMAQRLNANPTVTNGGNSASPFFKTSFSETSISSQNVMTYLKSNGQSVGSETHTSKSYHVISNGTAADESPSKSFIQQRVERLYGPGALAQGFFNQKKQLKDGEHNSSNGASGVTQISHTTRHVVIKKTQNGVTSENTFTENHSNGQEDGDSVLPVMRHLRAEFRAQLPILSPKRSPLSKISDNSNIITNNQIDTRLSGIDVVDRSTTNVSKPDDRLLSDAKVTIIPITKSESSERIDAPSTNGLKTAQFSDILVNGGKNVEVVAIENIPVVTFNVSAQVEIDLLPKCIIDDTVVQDGPFFLNLKRVETEKLLKLGDVAESCLVEVQDVADVSEEVKGFLRAAAGKARLLASQKMQQFEGLCHNNINRRPDDQFPTTDEDLRGFWDMVCLQIEDIRTIFEQINIMKGTNWKEVPVVKRTSDSASKSAPSTRSRLAKPKKPSANQTEAASAAKASAAKKRDEQRKALLEAKRRAVKADCDSSVEIFAPPLPGANTDVAKESS